jgi:L-rhamnose-H+ transport protein
MAVNPLLGLIFHWIGGLAAASFYLPFKAVRSWSWETYWLVGGVFSWIIAPLVMARLLTPGAFSAIRQSPTSALWWTFCFGALWGIGGLTFGLSVRYLGLALGYAIALGLCALFGSIVPPIFSGDIKNMFLEPSGQVTLLGMAVCVMGIAVSGMAGMSKENDIQREIAAQDVQIGDALDFNFVKGLLVATLAGVMSACMAFALQAAAPINELALAQGILRAATEDGLELRASAAELAGDINLQQLSEPQRKQFEDFHQPALRRAAFDVLQANRDLDKYAQKYAVWQGLPALILIMFGGFATSALWCLFLNLKNGSLGEYLGRAGTAIHVVGNYLLCALAGTTWYFQFFFYSMGKTQMGKYDFSSWTLHMASIIIFSTLWGIALKEWKGTSRKTHFLIALGLVTLIGSTMIVGYGNYLKANAVEPILNATK